MTSKLRSLLRTAQAMRASLLVLRDELMYHESIASRAADAMCCHSSLRK